ncbi:MAG: tyrosine-type recombinase/integrase [Hamadaea sp.]|uniref:site-specific integrase n=1 Tax=Hamadaea sp. TaxID=2024425 RepID=UPI00182F8C91|nr:site-specific integrase [Hamadaea sp.]NUT23806.1 tyrosine-type recombinase/integrase [Hamadaea sp.]
MTTRRSRGDGGLYWSESRQRWIAEATIGYTPAGKRITRKGSGKTKTEAKTKLKEVLRDHEDGLAIAPQNFTVADAVNDWLSFGLTTQAEDTRKNYSNLCRNHVLPGLGARKLRDLRADDVDRWLAREARTLSTRTLRIVLSLLNRSVMRAMARDKVKRNVVALCSVPKGQKPGRPSKALTLSQAKAVLDAAESSRIHAYIVLSLLTGARTEEMRALTWRHVDMGGRPEGDPPTPPSVEVWRSVRTDGDTKTRKSRRSLALPNRCVDALARLRVRQAQERATAGDRWHELGLVFATKTGRPLDAGNVRTAFRSVIRRAGLPPKDWTPRELRHSFVSILSDSGVRLEDIADLVGHAGTAVTEQVYRHQLRPVLLGGAVAMDEIFKEEEAPESEEDPEEQA